MRRLLAIAALCVGWDALAAAQTLSPAERAAVDSLFARFAKPGSPGCALGVYRNGAIAYAQGYGLASLELEVPITPRTVFDIGSVSKQLTAFAILLLEQRGKLSLDDAVRKFIPELPDYARKITLRHMIAHTSGLRDYADLFELAGVPQQNLTTDQDALDLIVRQKRLNFVPGAEWDYSNTGYFLLSQVVKRVSGNGMRDFARENIFEPLAMASTQIFDWHGQVVPRRATAYTYDEGRKTFAVEMSDFEQTGDGSVQTSVEDLLRWDENFYNAKLGGADLLGRMQIVGKLNNGAPHGYAAGLYIGSYRRQPSARHGGGWAGYRAELLRFPKQHTSVAVLCNLAQSGPTQLAYQVADIVLASALGTRTSSAATHSKPIKLAEDRLRVRTGLYRSEAGDYRRIALEGGKLYVFGRTPAAELIPESERSFKVSGSDVVLIFDDTGMVAHRPGRPSTPFSHVKPAPPQDVAPFAGRYFSAELQRTWEFRIKDGQLTLIARPVSDGSEPLVLVGDNTFTIAGGEVRFVSKPGEPMRAFVSLGKLRDMEFSRLK